MLGLVEFFCIQASHLVMGLVIGLIYLITMDWDRKRVTNKIIVLICVEMLYFAMKFLLTRMANNNKFS